MRPAGCNYLEGKVPSSPGKGTSRLNGRGVLSHCESDGSRKQSTGLTNRDRIPKVGDLRGLRLIRWSLEAGMMEEGLVQPRFVETPQPGDFESAFPHILLTELDRKVARCGHSFLRYADDAHLDPTRFLTERLKLGLNEAGSAVDWPSFAS